MPLEGESVVELFIVVFVKLVGDSVFDNPSGDALAVDGRVAVDEGNGANVLRTVDANGSDAFFVEFVSPEGAVEVVGPQSVNLPLE